VNTYSCIGIVHRRLLAPLVSEQQLDGFFRLTTVLPDAAEAPESAEIPLDQYEGSAIFVRGIGKDEWIYGATVVEQAGLILTVVVQVLFSEPVDPSLRDKLRFPEG
jgi:hypothetical protein